MLVFRSCQCLAILFFLSSAGCTSGSGSTSAVTPGPSTSSIAFYDFDDRFPVSAGDRLIVQQREIDSGIDRNGDGDTFDTTPFLIDPHAGSVIAVPLAAGTGTVANDDYAVFLVREGSQANDMNGDGDQEDAVPLVYELGTGEQRVLRFATQQLSLSGNLLSFLADENASGGADFNFDGDATDVVRHFYDLESGLVTNTELADRQGFSKLLHRPNEVLFNAYEPDQGEDLNNDGDRNDQVAFVYRHDLRSIQNLRLARWTTLPGAIGEDLVLFLVDEAAQGEDLDGDGLTISRLRYVHEWDTGRTLFAHFGSRNAFPAGKHLVLFSGDDPPSLSIFDPATRLVTETGLHGSASLLDAGRLYVSAAEAPLGIDWNGDGDTDDTAALLFDPSSGAITNLGLDGFLGTTRVPGGALFYGKLPDASDPTLHHVDLESLSVRDLGVTGRYHGSLGGTLHAIGVEENGVDLNGDGDTSDFVLHVLDTQDGSSKNHGLVSHKPSALGQTASFGDPVGCGVAVRMVEGLQGPPRDLNGDGDAQDFVVGIVQVPSCTRASNDG